MGPKLPGVAIKTTLKHDNYSLGRPPARLVGPRKRRPLRNIARKSVDGAGKRVVWREAYDVGLPHAAGRRQALLDTRQIVADGRAVAGAAGLDQVQALRGRGVT